MASENSTDGILRIIIIVLAVIILAPILMMIVAFPVIGMWGGMMGGYRITPLWGILMLVAWLVVIGGGGYLAYRWITGSRDDPAMKKLRLAYASGDISDEEFESRREKLRNE